TFVVPLAFAAAGHEEQIKASFPHAVIGRLEVVYPPQKQDASSESASTDTKVTAPKIESQTGLLYDPLGEKQFSAALLDTIARHRRCRGSNGELLAWTTPGYNRLRGIIETHPEAGPVKGELNNTSLVYGGQLLLKIWRCVEYGINPEVEMGRALAEKTSFNHIAPLAGALEYHNRWGSGKSLTLGVLQGFIPHEGDAW